MGDKAGICERSGGPTGLGGGRISTLGFPVKHRQDVAGLVPFAAGTEMASAWAVLPEEPSFRNPWALAGS